MSHDTAYERLLSRLRDAGCTVREGRNEAWASTPGHSAKDRGTHVTHIPESVLFWCNNADTDEVLIGLGYPNGRHDPGLYDKPKGTKVNGGVRHRGYKSQASSRVKWRSSGKDFTQTGDTSDDSLYFGETLNLGTHCTIPDDPDTVIYFTEGEKDADTLASRGHVAVCSPNGSNKAKLPNLGPLKGVVWSSWQTTT